MSGISTPTPSPVDPTPTPTPTPTDDDTIPGPGIVETVGSIAGAGYLLKWLMGKGSDEESRSRFLYNI